MTQPPPLKKASHFHGDLQGSTVLGHLPISHILRVYPFSVQKVMATLEAAYQFAHLKD